MNMKLRWAGGDAQRPVWCGNEPKKTGARSAWARTRGQNPLVTIYLPRVLCLCVCVCVCVRVCVCVSQFVSERSAILLVLVIKLTKETRREYAYHCLSLNWEECRFTVPPAVALLNYISSGILWRIFCQTGTFRGVSEVFRKNKKGVCYHSRW